MTIHEDCFKAFQESYIECEAANETWTRIDRGGFKIGFMKAWELQLNKLLALSIDLKILQDYKQKYLALHREYNVLLAQVEKLEAERDPKPAAIEKRLENWMRASL